jgi:hypothetical protein
MSIGTWSVAILAGLLAVGSEPHRAAGRMDAMMIGGGMVTGSAVSASQLAGSWQGGKTENNPYGGGYVNLSWRFVFSANGEYSESAYAGSTTVMTASGTYAIRADSKPRDPFYKSVIEFSPRDCRFAGDGRRVVAPFPIPSDRGGEYYVALSPLSGGGQLTLEATSGPVDSWGLKPGQ